jgi:probable rRNA maturation factor
MSSGTGWWLTLSTRTIEAKPVVSKPSLEIELTGDCSLWRGCEERLFEALVAAGDAEGKRGQVCVLLSDNAAIAALNLRFRNKIGPTNVLAFPAAQGPGSDFLGDIALAAEIIAEEASLQEKRFEDHAAHLVVHGFLHLLGYDHDDPDEAAAMEARERAILNSIGVDDPYAERVGA